MPCIHVFTNMRWLGYYFAVPCLILIHCNWELCWIHAVHDALRAQLYAYEPICRIDFWLTMEG